MQFDLDIGAQCFDGHILLGKKGQRIARFRNDFQGSDSRSRKELEGRFTALFACIRIDREGYHIAALPGFGRRMHPVADTCEPPVSRTGYGHLRRRPVRPGGNGIGGNGYRGPGKVVRRIVVGTGAERTGHRYKRYKYLFHKIYVVLGSQSNCIPAAVVLRGVQHTIGLRQFITRRVVLFVIILGHQQLLVIEAPSNGLANRPVDRRHLPDHAQRSAGN